MELILELINLYPYQISLNHNKKNLFFSIYGIIFSVFSYIIIFYLIHYFSYDLVNLKNPKISMKQTPINEKLNISLDKIIKELYIQGSVFFNLVNKDSFQDKIFNNSHNLLIEKKTNLDLIKVYQQKFIINQQIFNLSPPKIVNNKLYNHSLYFLFIVNNGTDFEITHDFQNLTKRFESFNEIHFNLLKEIIQIKYSFKKPEEISDFYINLPQKEYILYDNTIDTDEINYRQSIEKKFTFLNEEIGNFMYHLNEFKTDKNYFYSELSTDYIPQIDFFYTNFQNTFFADNEIHERDILSVEFRSIMNTHTRIYKKFINVLSELGGIFNTLLLIGNLLVLSFNKKKFETNILNKLFTDEDMNREINKGKKFDSYSTLSKKKKSMNEMNFEFNFDKNFNHSNNNTLVIKGKKGNFEKSNNISFNLIELKNLNNEIKNEELNLKDIYDRKLDDYFHDHISKDNLINNKNDETKNNKSILNGEENQKKFDFKEEKNINKEINCKILKENFKKLKNEENLEDIQIKNKIEEYLKTQKIRKLLVYSCMEVFLSVLCCNKFLNKNLTKKEETFCKISEKLEYYLEITNIMRLYENFEKMKFIIFNNSQLKCFEYMLFDVNISHRKESEKNNLFDIYKYFLRGNLNSNEKYYDESIKLLFKEEIKKILMIK